jgi:ABC-type dipeptide/oligopeptide/nickel transport system permease subunit
MRNEVPGTPLPSPEEGQYLYYLLGGDNLGRDVFSRMIYGAQEVLKITPAATLFAFMVGVTLGLPAGYFGGRLDTAITFIANLALAFPVILLFFLLVTPEIVAAGVPQYMSMVLFTFPIMFFVVLFNSRYHTQAPKRNLLVGATLVIGLVAYFSLISNADDADLPLVFRLWPEALDLFDIQGNLLIVFVSVVFVNSPTVFRIVRGIVLDIKTRDYVAAGQTRGEGSLVHHAVGDPAQRARAADRRFLPADRLHHDPSGHAGLLRPRRQPRKPGLGLDDQRGPQAPDDLSAPRPAAGAGADEPRSGSQPAGRRPARREPEGLMPNFLRTKIGVALCATPGTKVFATGVALRPDTR